MLMEDVDRTAPPHILLPHALHMLRCQRHRDALLPIFGMVTHPTGFVSPRFPCRLSSRWRWRWRLARLNNRVRCQHFRSDRCPSLSVLSIPITPPAQSRIVRSHFLPIRKDNARSIWFANTQGLPPYLPGSHHTSKKENPLISLGHPSHPHSCLVGANSGLPSAPLTGTKRERSYHFQIQILPLRKIFPKKIPFSTHLKREVKREFILTREKTRIPF